MPAVLSVVDDDVTFSQDFCRTVNEKLDDPYTDSADTDPADAMRNTQSVIIKMFKICRFYDISRAAEFYIKYQNEPHNYINFNIDTHDGANEYYTATVTTDNGCDVLMFDKNRVMYCNMYNEMGGYLKESADSDDSSHTITDKIMGVEPAKITIDIYQTNNTHLYNNDKN